MISEDGNYISVPYKPSKLHPNLIYKFEEKGCSVDNKKKDYVITQRDIDGMDDSTSQESIDALVESLDSKIDLDRVRDTTSLAHCLVIRQKAHEQKTAE